MPRSAPSTRRILALTSLWLLATGCSPVANAPPRTTSAPALTRPALAGALETETIVTALRVSQFPIDDIRVYTAETDPERSLGRPNQYEQQVAWRDQSVGEDATIEVFPTLASLEARRRLLLARSTRDGRLVEHVSVRTDRRALLRLPGTLDSRAVDDYQAWFASL